MRTSQAAESLGLTVQQLMHIRKYHGIDVPKDGDRYAWSEAHLEEIRAALRWREEQEKQAAQQGMTARAAAGKLGIAYDELLRLIHAERIPVPRLGPRQYYAFDEASLDLVRQALDNQSEPPPQPPRGLRTKEVATALGVSYEILLTVMKPLRKELSLEKDGPSLVWSPEAVALIREALDRRHTQQSIDEAEDYEQAVQSVEILAGMLRKMADDAQKLHGLLVCRPAETAFLHTVPVRTHLLAAPVRVLLIPVAKKGFQASLAELSLVTEGRTRQEALRLMRQSLWNRYREVEASPKSAAAEWTILQQLIVPRTT